MAGLTLAQCEAKLAEWMAADTAVQNNQSYTIDGRSLSRVGAKVIQENIDIWDRRCQRKGRTGGGPSITYAVPK